MAKFYGYNQVAKLRGKFQRQNLGSLKHASKFISCTKIMQSKTLPDGVFFNKSMDGMGQTQAKSRARVIYR